MYFLLWNEHGSCPLCPCTWASNSKRNHSLYTTIWLLRKLVHHIKPFSWLIPSMPPPPGALSIASWGLLSMQHNYISTACSVPSIYPAKPRASYDTQVETHFSVLQRRTFPRMFLTPSISCMFVGWHLPHLAENKSTRSLETLRH